MAHGILRLVFAFGAGSLLAFYAYDRATNPDLGAQRRQEEAAVLAAREILRGYVEVGARLEIVDPLAPKRAIGKAFVYPAGSGWEISGHYRRDDADGWHPFLMRLDERLSLVSLQVRDARLESRAADDTRLIVR